MQPDTWHLEIELPFLYYSSKNLKYIRINLIEILKAYVKEKHYWKIQFLKSKKWQTMPMDRKVNIAKMLILLNDRFNSIPIKSLIHLHSQKCLLIKSRHTSIYCTSLYCPSQMLLFCFLIFLQIKSKNLHQQDYNSVYCAGLEPNLQLSPSYACTQHYWNFLSFPLGSIMCELCWRKRITNRYLTSQYLRKKQQQRKSFKILR